jgi:cytochrome c551/c552
MSRTLQILRALFFAIIASAGAYAADSINTFIDAHCTDCHNSDVKKGGLDLSILNPDFANPKTFAAWVKIHDRVKAGEMPPKKKPTQAEAGEFLKALSSELITADKVRIATEGRATRRRLNRFEYEDTLRDLLNLPGLQVKEFLPEDGEAHLFNKVGDALDVSHVNMARYLTAADYALRQAVAVQVEKPVSKTTKYYARDQGAFAGAYKVGPNIRSTFPLIGTKGQPDVVAGKAPKTVGDGKPGREEEAVGFGASTYEPTEIRFNNFKAPYTGPYKLRFNTYTVWAASSSPERYWNPDWGKLSPGRRDEPITIYSDTSPRILRKLGGFDATPEPQVSEMYVWLQKGETIRPDAARFLRPRPPEMKNPLATKDGMPAVALGRTQAALR